MYSATRSRSNSIIHHAEAMLRPVHLSKLHCEVTSGRGRSCSFLGKHAYPSCKVGWSMEQSSCMCIYIYIYVIAQIIYNKSGKPPASQFIGGGIRI